ncbi:MAG TPA: cupredoxin domain-containing protein [Candidatus Limnocylindrales bacterium]|nr:cupredoxin domain-containing protein [Candidatus Limnocylindrales bacterium]
MKRFLQGAALAGIAVLTVACSGGGSTPAPASVAPGSPGASAPAGSGLVVVADLAFSPTSLTVKADTPTEIVLDNQEAAPHNIAIKDAAGATVFKGEIVSSKQVTNAVPALAAGSYTFWCEVHPNMTGTLTAE